MNRAGVESVTVSGSNKGLLLVIGHIVWTDVVHRLQKKVCHTKVLEIRIAQHRPKGMSTSLQALGSLLF
jgi:hypothetical protein